MMLNTLSRGVENICPKLVSGATVTKFSESIFFVQFEDRIVKIDSFENSMVERFDGETPLSEIISNYLDNGKTDVFSRLLNLLSKLSRGDLIEEKTAGLLKNYRKDEKILFNKSLAQWKFKDNKLLSLKGKIIFSIPVIMFFILLSACSFSIMPTIKGVNVLKQFGAQVVPEQFSYLFSIVFSFFVLSAVLSITSLSAVTGLLAKGLEAKISLRTSFGVFYLHTDPSAIFSSGRKSAVKHFLMLILIPFSIAGTASLIWYNGVFENTMTIVHTVAFSVGLFFTAPLFGSFFLKICDSFIPGELQVFTFLRKKFVKEIFTFGKTTKEMNGLIFLSSVGLIWIFVVYKYFWEVMSSTLSYLLADVINTGVFPAVFIILALCLVCAPLLFIFATGITVLFGNIRSVARSPYVKMNRLSASILSKKVPSKAQIYAFLKKIPLFSGLNEAELAKLCAHIRLLKFSPGKRIIQQGEKGDAFYTMVSGKANVVVEESTGEEMVVENLTTGDSFGEISLLEEIPRTAGVVTVTPTAVFEIKKGSFTEFVVASAGGMEKVTDQIRLGKLLIGISLFSFMTPKQISQIINKLETIELGTDVTIFDQGDDGDKFYIIREGRVSIKGVDNGEVVVDKTLERGDFFGEIALIKKVLRTASAKTLTECKLSVLSKEAFLHIFSSSLLGGVKLEETVNERIVQLGKEALRSCG